MHAARTYARTQNETASKERLMVLLFEAALRHMRTAAPALESRRYAEGLTAVAKASDIVTELMCTLNHQVAPELCQQLTAVYRYVHARLLVAQTDRDARAVRDAERAFIPVATGFGEAVRQVEAGLAPGQAR
jgi:flagellar secretion chaperone FliS